MKPRQIFGKNPAAENKQAYQKIRDKDCVVFYAQMKRKGRIAILKDNKGYSVMQSIAGEFGWQYTEDFKRLSNVCNKGGFGPFDVRFWEDDALMLDLREKMILHKI